MHDTDLVRFTQDDAERAFDEWGCNCGPSALAASLGLTLDEVRAACEFADFASRRYMSPTMMLAALGYLGAQTIPRKVRGRCKAPLPKSGLVRIQWTGPWTASGANQKWAYRQTHWIAAWQQGALWTVFDAYGGLLSLDEWRERIAPLLTANIPHADGDWFVTHCWEVTPT